MSITNGGVARNCSQTEYFSGISNEQVAAVTVMLHMPEADACRCIIRNCSAAVLLTRSSHRRCQRHGASEE
jgi:hypothetical protein